MRAYMRGKMVVINRRTNPAKNITDEQNFMIHIISAAADCDTAFAVLISTALREWSPCSIIDLKIGAVVCSTSVGVSIERLSRLS